MRFAFFRRNGRLAIRIAVSVMRNVAGITMTISIIPSPISTPPYAGFTHSNNHSVRSNP